MRFRLRTLLIVVTLVAVFLAYEVDWLRRRREAIANYEAAFVKRHPETQKVEASRWYKMYLQSGEKPAPQFLWLFGEKGHNRILLVVPDADTIVGESGAWEIERSQPVYRVARRLFPESEIEVASHFTAGDFQAVGWHGTNVRN